MYNKYLAETIYNFYKNNKFSIGEMSKMFNIPKSTIHRWIHSDDPKNIIIKNIKNNNDKENIKKIICDQLIANPLCIAKDLQHFIKNKINIFISLSSIYIYAHQLGFVFKKLSRRNYCNSKVISEKTKQFKNKIRNIKNKNIICIDESFFYSNQLNDYGWVNKNKNTNTLIYTKANPTKYSLIMAISNTKIISHQIIKNDNFNKLKFIDFLNNKVLPIVSNKYILMDNVNFHKSKDVINLIASYNNKILFIPPYSPQFNPIENVFFVVKKQYKSITTSKNDTTINNIISFFDYNLEKFYNNSFKNFHNHNNIFI